MQYPPIPDRGDNQNLDRRENQKDNSQDLIQSASKRARRFSHLVTIDDLVIATQLPKTWWYKETRKLGPEAVPRLKCGKYLRFELAAVIDWLRNYSKAGD